VESTGQRGTFRRVMFVLAAVVVVLAGMRLAAPVLNPILFALVFAALFAPVYSWLRRRLPTALALLSMLVGLTILFGVLFVLLSASITELTSRLGFYAKRLNGRVGDIQDLIDRLGLSDVNLSDAISGSAVVGALGTVLSGLAGFLSSLFLVLFIVLFLLSEGSAMMGRLRASVAADNVQVARLTFIGQSVVRQFGLRAIVNLVTGAGITVLLFLLGVDFPLLWGVLAFFLSYVPYIASFWQRRRPCSWLRQSSGSDARSWSS
jgi:AI-2 transport protein TqsA